jgi:queuosine precursor transporter
MFEHINEVIFFTHISIICIATLVALRMGKEALVALISVQAILSNLFVLKEVVHFGLASTGGDAFTIGTVLGLNLLQEYYGRAISQKAIWISLFSLLFYGLVSQIHIFYIPHPLDEMHTHFNAILSITPRVLIASFIVYFITHQLDYILYGALKRMFDGKYLIFRNYCSVLIVQLVDTLLFSFLGLYYIRSLGLYGIIDNVPQLWETIAISYLIKVIAVMVSTPFLALSHKIYKPTES